MDGYCTNKVKAAQDQWRKAKQACAAVEQRLGRLQRTTSSGEAQAVTGDLQTDFYAARQAVQEASASLAAIDDYCYGL